MSEPKWSLIEWEQVYGITYSLTNDNDDLVQLWGGRFHPGIIRLYLANVEDAVDRIARRQPWHTDNDWHTRPLRW